MRPLEPKLSKKSVLKTLKGMPDTFVAEDLIERIILLEKIERGLRQSANGETLTTDEARRKLRRWLK